MSKKRLLEESRVKHIKEWPEGSVLLLSYLLGSFLLFLLYFCFLIHKNIDANTAVLIPTLLVSVLTIVWNISRNLLKLDKHKVVYKVAEVCPIIIIILSFIMEFYLLKNLLANVSLADWIKVFILPVFTFLTGVIYPWISGWADNQEKPKAKAKTCCFKIKSLIKEKLDCILVVFYILTILATFYISFCS